ncbi:MAG: uL15 family ribosomal protein, partial [Clostridia bacterium]|nr:uL15 family ribosomal protein [Clostridia bacterium]
TAYAASEKVAEFHFWAVNAGSGTKTDNGITFSYSGVTAHEHETSKVSIASGGTLRITVAEDQLTANSIGKAAFSIRVDSGIAISYNLKRGSTTLSSGSGKTSYDVGETSIAGSGDLVLEFTNNSGSAATGVHFENPNFALYEITKRTVSITAGTGVKSVYMSTSSTATSGDSSGTQYADGTKVYGFATIADGYNPQSGWTLVSGKTYCVGSKTISSSQKSFGTVSAQLATYTISYTLNGGTLPSGYPASYNITTNTFSLSNPTRKGYTFSGWTGSNGSTKQTSVSIAKGSTGNKSYTANWTANSYTVTLSKNNGTGGSDSVSATYGSAMPSATMPTRTGYTFTGYFDSNNVKYYNANGTSAKNWDTASTATLTAKWQINQYPVSCPENTAHASYFVSSNANATSGSTSGNFDYNSTVYFYVVADEGYYKPKGSSWEKTGTVGDRIVYRANSWTVSTGTYEFSAVEPDIGDTISASATGYNAPFDKASHSITVNVTTPESDYVIKYKVGNGDYSATKPQYTNVCNVTVEYKITADGYYPFFGGATIKITQQENVSYTTAPDKIENLIYNGSAQALLTAGTSNYGTVQYKLGDAGEWTNTVPQVQNVGDYVVYYRVPEDANQVGISESSFTVSIAEVNKDELNDIIATVDAYYGTIIDGYSSIAETLNGHRQQIYNDYYADPNVTETQVAEAVIALNVYLDDAKKSVTEAKIDAIGTVSYTADIKAKIDDAKNYFDNELNEAQKELVNSDKKTALQNAISLYNDVDAVVNVINSIGEPQDTEAFRQAVIDAREEYNALGVDRKAIFPADVLKTLTDYEVAIDVMNLINAIGDVEYTADSKGKIDAANDAYADLEDDQKLLVVNYDKLLQANTDYDKVDEAIGKINAIGDVEYTADIKAKIDDARETYDALSAYQKSIFPEDVLKKLIDDEKAYESMDKIRAIGTIENTPTSKGKIVEARKTYDALKEDQKALVLSDFVKELEDAEAAFYAIEQVNAIGDIRYNEDSKDLIAKARATYNALSADQKKLVPSFVFDALETAETTYETIEKNAKTLSTVMNIVLGVLLVGGIIILILLLRKRKDEDNDGKKKVLSVSALPLFLAANHYFDGAFIVLYILVVLTLTVWCVNLYLFIQKRKNQVAEVIEDETPLEEDNDEPDISNEDDTEEIEGETIAVTEDNGTKFYIRRIKSFTAKLIQSDDDVKAFYGELKNEVLSYEKTLSRVSWHYDSVYYGRKPVLKFGIRGKTLCVYFALDVKDFKATKYKVELCESKKFALVSCMYRIKNEHRCTLAKDLIATVCANLGLVKGEQHNIEYSFPYEYTEALIEKGLIKELKTKVETTETVVEHHHAVTVSEADAEMSDEVAETYIKDDVDGKVHKGKKAIINIDLLSANFNDGDTVDIEALWEKKLVAKNVGQVKVLAKGTLDKVLNVDLQDYSLQAVKMIVLVGGTVHRAK